MEDNLRETFFPGVKNDEEMVMTAFCKISANNALKTRPKGYAADHKDVALLRLRNYILRKNISDQGIMSGNALKIIGDMVEAIEPFITYLNDTVMPGL